MLHMLRSDADMMQLRARWQLKTPRLQGRPATLRYVSFAAKGPSALVPAANLRGAEMKLDPVMKKPQKKHNSGKRYFKIAAAYFSPSSALAPANVFLCVSLLCRAFRLKWQIHHFPFDTFDGQANFLRKKT